jgi:hypothetical protein
MRTEQACAGRSRWTTSTIRESRRTSLSGGCACQPPGYRRKLSKAQRKQKVLAEKRAEARAARLHLAGLTDAAVIVMGLAGAAVVVMVVLALISHH